MDSENVEKHNLLMIPNELTNLEVHDLEVAEMDEETIVHANTGNVESHNSSKNPNEILNLEINEVDEETLTNANPDAITKCVRIEGSLIGVTRKSVDDMFDLYRKHARAIGFSVRKSTTRYSVLDRNIVVGKEFVCSCEGRKLKMEEAINWDGKKRKNMGITRTGCRGMMTVRLNDFQLFEVVVHDMIHNHELTRPQLSHLHRSSRQITDSAKMAISVMHSSGMKATQSYRYMVEDAGGRESVGHTLKDHLNLYNTWEMLAIESGDAENVIEMLQEKAAGDKDFFYRVKLDEQRRLSHIFWRDSMMREDYELFGDILVFDTTYRTNKYNLICAPFIGVNNHWKNIMYGCAFISDEKIDSFEWLFEIFKKSMGGKSPITIFTDQDLSISTAIEKAFPETRHRLCIWHLHQNAVKRYSRLKKDQDFQDIFNKCLTGCIDEEEFEMCWNDMVSRYDLKKNTWFTRLYNLRHKWCTGLSKDFFSAGILSSQRSESTNSAIGLKSKRTTNLTQFYGIFDETVKDWRYREQQDEFQCARTIPESTLPMRGLLKHASEVYTLKNFRIFEEEFKEAISNSSKLIRIDGPFGVYEVKPYDGTSTYTVIYDDDQKIVRCTCKKFEECGFLCNHSLRILHIYSVDSIPSAYIKKRWTKQAKVEVWNKFQSVNDETGRLTDSIPWRHQIQRKMYNMLLKSQDIIEAREMLEERCEQLDMDLNALISSLNREQQEVIEDPNGPSNQVLDPLHAKTKGRSQRKKSHLERINKKKKVSSSSSLATEIGSKTPNPRLL